MIDFSTRKGNLFHFLIKIALKLPILYHPEFLIMGLGKLFCHFPHFRRTLPGLSNILYSLNFRKPSSFSTESFIVMGIILAARYLGIIKVPRYQSFKPLYFFFGHIILRYRDIGLHKSRLSPESRYATRRTCRDDSSRRSFAKTEIG